MANGTYISELVKNLPTVDLQTMHGIVKIDKFSKLPLCIVEEHFSSSVNKALSCDVNGCSFETAVNSYRFCHIHKYQYCQTCICPPSETSKVFDHPQFRDFNLCFRCISVILHCGIGDEHSLLKNYLKNVKVVINIKKEGN